MGKLNLYCTYTPSEWESLEKIASKRKRGDIAGKGLTNLLRVEITRLFSGNQVCLPCLAMGVMKVQKHFEIDLPDKTIEIIECLSAQASVGPSVLVSRLILNQYLNSLGPEET